MTDASIGYGSLFEISTNGGGAWTAIAEVTNITPPTFAIDAVDATHMQSPNRDREFIPGLNDPGEASLEMNFLPGSASEALLLGVKGTKVKCRITWPNGVKFGFDGILTGYAPAAPFDDKMTATATFKVTGSVVVTAAAAPANVIKPAISGLAKVGQPLTALPGEWSGAPTFAYQWKKAGANIAGANASTYTPVGGDVGAAITVLVTASNSVGPTPAESAATANVIA
ncbi:MAG: putative major tail protein [Xanthobacteraceae bacterium]|jgi:hypothetical protein|nr:putative major tail protein [Xanthobacteraceae bacterium]